MIKETETMKTRNQILIGTGIAVLILASFYIFFPFWLVGPPPDPLYRIQNDDIYEHKVVVELFDSHNKTVLIKTHIVDPGEEVRYPKPLWLLLPGSDGKYTIDITLDGEIRKTREIMMHPWMMVWIDLYDPIYSEEPLTISEITV